MQTPSWSIFFHFHAVFWGTFGPLFRKSCLIVRFTHRGSDVIPGDCDVITLCCHAELGDETFDESSVKLGSVSRSADAT